MSQCRKLIHQGQHVDLGNHHILPFRYINHLGKGMSAVVNEVEDETNGQRFAHKIFDRCYGVAGKRLKQRVRDEIDIIKRLHSHPHVIEVYWSYTRGSTFGMLLTPVASNGDLGAYLHIIRDTQDPLTSEHFSILSRAFGCLASGLAFIHSRTIRHKDIKPNNILVHNGRMIYTDFGIAFDASGQDTTTTGLPDAHTKRYCAPEVANCEPRNRKSDVFSLGCVFLEIMASLAPEFDLGTSDDSPPYFQRISAIQNNLIRIGNSGTSAGQVFLICRAMLECKSADRVGADAVLYQVQRLRCSCPESIYELFCEDCEGAFPIIAEIATNKVAVAIYDTSSDSSSERKSDKCQEEDEGSQVESSMVLSKLTIDPQTCKS
jgi:serine/threonine protein kinase